MADTVPNRAPPASDAAFFLRRAWPALVMLTLTAAVFWRVLFAGEGLSADGGLVTTYQPWKDTALAKQPIRGNDLLRDQYGTFNANEEFLWRWVRRGVWPLWNPDIAHGVPTVASIQNAEYYPTNLLLWFLPPFWTRGIRSILRIALGLWGTYAFARAIGIGRIGATFASISFGFAGPNVVWLGHPVTNVTLLLPCILWTLERTLEQGGFRWVAGLALAGGAVLLGGHTPTVLHIGVAVFVWLLYRLLLSPDQPTPRLPVGALAWRLGLAGVAAVCIGSAAILPWREYLAVSPGSVFPGIRNIRTLSWRALAVWIVPDFYGTPVFPSVYWGGGLDHLAGWENYCERTGYVGVAALLIAAVALVAHRPRRVVVPWLVTLLVSLVLIYDPPVLGALFRGLPAFRVINNSKILCVAAFSLAMLTGHGCDVVFERRGSPVLAWVGAGITALALALFIHAVWPSPEAQAALTRAGALGQFTWNCLWTLVPATAVVVAIALGRRSPSMAAAVLLGVAMLDLWRFASGFNPTIPREQAAPPTPGIRYLQDHVTDARVLPIGPMVLFGNTMLRYGVPDVRGVDWINVSQYEYLVTGHTGGYDFCSTLLSIPATLPALNVSHAVFPAGTQVPAGARVVYDDELRIVRLPDGLPRALLLHDARVVASDAEARRLIASHAVDLHRTVLLGPDASALARTVSESDGGSVDSVRIAVARPNDLRIAVEAGAPGVLLLNDTFFPGWRCAVDGREVPIARANVAFRAVPIGPGRHEVVFRYRPWPALLGIALALAALAAIALTGAVRALLARRTPASVVATPPKPSAGRADAGSTARSRAGSRGGRARR